MDRFVVTDSTNQHRHPEPPSITTSIAASPETILDFKSAPAIWWRLAIASSIILIASLALSFQSALGGRGQALAGAIFFIGLVAVFSCNLTQVNWRTVFLGFGLQVSLALLVLKGQITWGDQIYTVKSAFERVGDGFKLFMGFSDKGAEFVFGNLAHPEHLAQVYGGNFLFPFAFKALPAILFVSAMASLLYHYRILQWCIRVMAWSMTYLMRTSGAETLSVAANVFMGQTEAPLIVKPYVPRMTNSELFALMVSGFAHISGGMMVVYINYGADPAAVLTTCVMACPCSLYLAKLFLPETTLPETGGSIRVQEDQTSFVNGLDALVTGTGEGLRLAMNVAAMLIVFIALVAMLDASLAGIKPLLLGIGVSPEILRQWPDNLSLGQIFGWILAPVACLIGIESQDTAIVGRLLGAKLAINEHFAYLQFKAMEQADPHFISERSKILSAFALTGFANFASVGIQLGGIGAIAPGRQSDLAKLGGKALFVGFTATLLNASIAGVLI